MTDKYSYCIIGMGTIGLPLSFVIKEKEPNETICGVDTDSDKINNILNFADSLGLDKRVIDFPIFDRIVDALIYIICVPTPITDDRKADVSAVEEVVDEILNLPENIGKELYIIVESTVSIGTMRRIKEKVSSYNSNSSVIYTPERAYPGCNLLEEMKNNERIAGIGDIGDLKVLTMYKFFDFNIVTYEEAELIKITENNFRNINIAFANELNNFCMEFNDSHTEQINIWDIIKLANKHPRVNILEPGIGTGGHCIPVDPHFLESSRFKGLTEKALEINEKQHIYFEEYFISDLIEQIKPCKIVIVGVSYKEDGCDLRNSPSIRLKEYLENKYNQLEIVAWDPVVKEYSDLSNLKNADLLVFTVKHSFIKNLSARFLKEIVDGGYGAIIDCCGVINKDKYVREGFEIYGIPR